jgi:hypothetical protein
MTLDMDRVKAGCSLYCLRCETGFDWQAHVRRTVTCFRALSA